MQKIKKYIPSRSQFFMFVILYAMLAAPIFRVFFSGYPQGGKWPAYFLDVFDIMLFGAGFLSLKLSTWCEKKKLEESALRQQEKKNHEGTTSD